VADLAEILNKEQTRLVQAERELLAEFNKTLSDFGVPEDDRILMSRLIEGLDELFLLVVIGEFNSGKSAFINALLGKQVLTEGVTPTTSQINVLRYAEQPYQRVREGEVLEVYYPAPFLRDISLVDTPGTNAVIERHQELTEDFVPRSDLVLFVTSAERPFTQSEREFLTRVRDWGKKIVVIVNKIDVLPDPAQREQVLNFVRDQFARLLQLEPAIFPASGRLAQRARQTNDPQLWQASGFGPLETFIFQTLDQRSRLRLKLLNPLQVSRRMLSQHTNVVRDRLALLEQDARTVDDIERQLTIYSQDLRNDFKGRISTINNLLYELNERGDQFFDNILRVSKVRELIKTDKIKQDFQTLVIGDTPRRIEQAVQELVDWLVERDLRLWQDITGYLNQRRQAGAGSESLLVRGGALENFNSSRQALLRDVSQKARAVVETYDQRREAEELAQSTRDALTQATLAQVGAVGIGAGLAILIGSAAADVTGILFAVVLGGLGFYIIPARRRQAKIEFRRKIEDLRIRLNGVLQDQFEAEQQRSINGVRDAISPYSRFVRAEQGRFGEFAATFEDFTRRFNFLDNEIENVLPDKPLLPDGTTIPLPPAPKDTAALPPAPASNNPGTPLLSTNGSLYPYTLNEPKPLPKPAPPTESSDFDLPYPPRLEG